MVMTIEPPAKAPAASPKPKRKKRHWLNADRRQRIAVCTMAVAIGFMIDAFLGPMLPSFPLPANWCLGLSLAGYAIAAGILVYLWHIC
jgi:hypothetical protein